MLCFIFTHHTVHSSWCCVKILSLVDFDLKTTLVNLDMKQYYSFLIQLFNIFYLLHANNYMHGDIHLGNVGCCKIDNEFIYIFDLKIPTYGYTYKLIDFGNSHINEDEDKSINFDIIGLLKIIIDVPIYESDLKYFINLFKYSKFIDINKLILNENYALYFFIYAYCDVFKSIILKSNFKYKNHYLKINPKINIKPMDLFFILKNIHDYKLIIKYLHISLSYV